MKELTVIAPVNPLRAYSGVKYLCDALVRKGVNIYLWADIPVDMLEETKDWIFPVRSLSYESLKNIPRIRAIPARLQVLRLGLQNNHPMVFVDLSYVPEMVMIKKLRPRKYIIHYCPELYTREAVTDQHQWILDIYEKNASVPNLIVDVEADRARIRKERYNLPFDPLVIPNTVPVADFPSPAPAGSLSSLAQRDLPKDRPILLYTGGASQDRNWNLLIAALKQIQDPPYFLAFCYANKYEVDQVGDLRKMVASELGDNAKICDPVPRHKLLACIHEADAGIVYYPPSLSPNHLYAAPSKLFEYIAAGLPVVTSNNPNIVQLVRSGGFGVSTRGETPQDLAAAITELFSDKARLQIIRGREMAAFRTELCYEVAAEPAIRQIVDAL